MVQQHFPSVLYHRQQSRTGCPGARNIGLKLADSPIVIFIDDDAMFQDALTVTKVISDFDHPRVAAVAMPYIERNKLNQAAPDLNGIYLTNYYYGCAHALRKDFVEKEGGYRAELEFYVEEPDLCIRLLHRGYVTRLGRSPPVLHMPSTDRQSGLHELSHQVRARRRLRNETLFKWWHTPSHYLIPVLAHHVMQSLGKRRGSNSRWAGFTSIVDAFAYIRKTGQKRQPVSRRTYQIWRKLAAEQPVPLDRIINSLA